MAEQGKNGVHDRHISRVHNPTLTVYLPPRDKATGAAVVICPGGGHRFLAIDHEGYDVAKYLNSIGVAGIVLKYRLARTEGADYKVERPCPGRRPARDAASAAAMPTIGGSTRSGSA